MHDHVVTGERGADDARVAVEERSHRVEEVGDTCGRRRRRPRSPPPRWRPSGRTRPLPRDAAGARSAHRRRELGCEVISRTGPAASSRSSSSTSGSRRAPGRWIPSRSSERNGPSRCTPRTRGPSDVAGTSRRAARSCSSGAVTKVGRYAVTPVSSRASPAPGSRPRRPRGSRRRRSRSPAGRRSPGRRCRARWGRRGRSRRPAVGDLDVAAHERPSTIAASTPSLIRPPPGGHAPMTRGVHGTDVDCSRDRTNTSLVHLTRVV